MTDTPNAREDVARALRDLDFAAMRERLPHVNTDQLNPPVECYLAAADAALTAAAPHHAAAIRAWANRPEESDPGIRVALRNLDAAADTIAATVCGGEK
jgi:hypothetical protein